MRNALLVLAAVAVVIAVVIGANQAPRPIPPRRTPARALTLAEVSRPCGGRAREARGAAPPRQRARARRQRALDEQLRALRGHPVVVNLWASWCGPCRHELPFFQRQAVKRGARIAFVGVNSNDSRDNARELAARYPMPYPSFGIRGSDVAGATALAACR